MRTKIAISNGGCRNSQKIEIIRIPIKDEELCACTCVRKGRIIIVSNSILTMSKQIFAAAHELYHIIPEDIASTHYHDISVHINNLLKDNRIVPLCDRNVVIDSIRSIFLMIPHKGEIGNNYETVLSFFIDGVCKNNFSA